MNGLLFRRTIMALKTAVVGSGNWGSAIAGIVGETCSKHAEFDQTVKMWVYEEMVNGRKLSEIINVEHENVKYLPRIKLSENVIGVPDLIETVHDADILIFVVPHQFIRTVCHQMVGKIKPNAIGISLVKGFEVTDYIPRDDHGQGLASHKDGGIKLISEVISEILNIEVAALMGANLAHEVAAGNFCEATIGCEKIDQYGNTLKKLFHTDNFRIVVAQDAHTVELCGALKNVVACAAGFVDGLGYGDNTKAAVIRLGLMEMTKFIEFFYPGSNLETFFESCGIADLVTTCYGGRNRRVCEAFAKTRKPMEQLEREMLNGQSLQGPHTAEQVQKMLQCHQMPDKFPLFNAVHHVCTGKLLPEQMIDCLRSHPEHMRHVGQ